MKYKRILHGVKRVLTDDSLNTIVCGVETRLKGNIFDGTKTQHDSDCRCRVCWETFQALWVKLVVIDKD